jgi:hypothetical protein
MCSSYCLHRAFFVQLLVVCTEWTAPTRMAQLPSSSSVDHVLGTIQALAGRFNSSGSDFVETLDVHALESQAAVICTILKTLTAALPTPTSSHIKHSPAEWNTWLTTSACSRPSSLPGRKAGRMVPQAVPCSNSVWWLDKKRCEKAADWLHCMFTAVIALFVVTSCC